MEGEAHPQPTGSGGSDIALQGREIKHFSYNHSLRESPVPPPAGSRAAETPAVVSEHALAWLLRRHPSPALPEKGREHPRRAGRRQGGSFWRALPCSERVSGGCCGGERRASELLRKQEGCVGAAPAPSRGGSRGSPAPSTHDGADRDPGACGASGISCRFVSGAQAAALWALSEVLCVLRGRELHPPLIHLCIKSDF